ncbi:uncharacterized protein LOC108742547, partial [Agrilus planipennis]|uniref:Uncharacterized protein LOC108742547 n=1 Tax=Agrilus planipennis TaxID=224129 RepID=A0A7F5RDB9_AGRPL
MVRENQLQDSILKKILEAFAEGKELEIDRQLARGYLVSQGVIYRYVPELYAEEPQLRITSRYYWIGMRKDIITYLKDCIQCQRFKATNLKPAELMQILVMKQRPFLSLSQIYTLSSTTSKAYAITILDEILLRYGTPRRMISDNGTQLVTAAPEDQTRWDEALPSIRFALNTALAAPRELRTPEEAHEALQAVVQNDNLVALSPRNSPCAEMDPASCLADEFIPSQFPDSSQYRSIFSNKIWSDDEVSPRSQPPSENLTTVSRSSSPVAHSDSGIHQSTIEEEGTPTEWTPEIPFENLHRTLSADVGDNSINLSCCALKLEQTDIKIGNPSIPKQVDKIIDRSIEIESNKWMRSANVNPWLLRFKDPEMEKEFNQLREDMFKSNMLCCYVIWIFMVICQLTMLSQYIAVVVSLLITTALLSCTTILVMAEEFNEFPKSLQKISSILVHNHRCRTAFVCAIILTMSVMSSIGLFVMDVNKVGNFSINNITNDSTHIMYTAYHLSSVPPKNSSKEEISSTLIKTEIRVNTIIQGNITIIPLQERLNRKNYTIKLSYLNNIEHNDSIRKI